VTRVSGSGVLHRQKAICEPPERSRPQALTHGDRYLEALTVPPKAQRLFDFGRWVARLTWTKDTLLYRCSGFLVDNTLLVSNHHCLEKQPDVSEVKVEFNVNRDSDVAFTAKIKRVALAAKEIDIAIYELDTTVTAPERNPLKQSTSPEAQIRPWMIAGTGPGETLRTDLRKKQSLALIQHPNGKPKKIALYDCQVTHTGPNERSNGLEDFGHFCDSEWGSSGSPVLDFDTGKVVGIHYDGFGDGVQASKDDPLRVNRAIQVHLLYKRMMDSKDPMLMKTASERAK
jgi:V8-like Glu-specific endopeptidase